MSRIVQLIAVRSRLLGFSFINQSTINVKNMSSTPAVKKRIDVDLQKDLTKNYVLYRADYLATLYKAQFASFIGFAGLLYMGWFIRECVTDEPIELEKKRIEESGRGEDAKLYSTWSKLTHFQDKFKWSLIAICLVCGYGTLIGVGFYITRCVHGITLIKGGKEVIVKTPPSIVFIPKFEERTYPVDHFSSVITRDQAKAYLPIKIKGRAFYYLLKTDGEFPNPLLFDKTIGRRRKSVA